MQTKVSSGVKIEIKQAPPCPFCNKEFPLKHYTQSQNFHANGNTQEVQKKGYTYREAESIIEDKVDSHHFVNQNNFHAAEHNVASYGGGYAESNGYNQNNAYLYQDYNNNENGDEDNQVNGDQDYNQVIHKNSEELGKEVILKTK